MIYLQIHFQNIIPCSSTVSPKPTNHLSVYSQRTRSHNKAFMLFLTSFPPPFSFLASPLPQVLMMQPGWPYNCSCLHLLHAGIPGVHPQDQQSFLFLNDLLFKMADRKDRKHVTVKLLEWPTPSVRLIEQAYTSLDSSDYALV